MLDAMDGGPLLPIGRFSQLAHLTIHQLRHYHEVGLLQPAHVDQESGYRYYSSAQVQAADLIALLRSLDVSLADIRRLLAHPDRATVDAILSAHRRRLEARFREAEHRLRDLDQLLKEGSLHMAIEIPRDSVPVTVEMVRRHPESGQHLVLLLTDGDEPRRLPMWIGPSEASAIAARLEGGSSPRPMTHDLLAALTAASGATVQAVTVWAPAGEGRTFLAAIELDGPGGPAVLDSRPSDAINLALRVGAPIRVSTDTLERAGIDAGDRVSRQPPRVALRDEDGRDLGETVTIFEPRPGGRVAVQHAYEITGVDRVEETRFVATVRAVPEETYRALVT